VEMPPDDQAAAVHVDVHGLADFATDLRAEIDKNLRPYLNELINIYRSGPRFGPLIDSANVRAARSHYQDCLGQIINQLDACARGGATLADAADLIAQRYRDADALAGATVASVTAAVQDASQSHRAAAPMQPADSDMGVIRNGRGAL
jgi:hypothetical protein